MDVEGRGRARGGRGGRPVFVPRRRAVPCRRGARRPLDHRTTTPVRRTLGGVATRPHVAASRAPGGLGPRGRDLLERNSGSLGDEFFSTGPSYAAWVSREPDPIKGA